MVKDRIDDGKRIAQLLASELTGLERTPLDRVGVVDATPEVEPTPDGVEAYGVAVDDERIGSVTVYPDSAVLSVRGTLPPDHEAGPDLTVERVDDRVQVRVSSGAAVKRAVDLLAAVVSA